MPSLASCLFQTGHCMQQRPPMAHYMFASGTSSDWALNIQNSSATTPMMSKKQTLCTYEFPPQHTHLFWVTEYNPAFCDCVTFQKSTAKSVLWNSLHHPSSTLMELQHAYPYLRLKEPRRVALLRKKRGLPLHTDEHNGPRTQI